MSKAVGIVGTNGHANRVSFQDTPQALAVVGHNTGNLFFQYAITNAFTDDKAHVGSDVSWDPAEARERFRVLVVPSANFIRENFDPVDFINYLEKTQLPLVFIGLGVQADSYDKREFDLSPSIRKLIGLLKERSVTVGVRGEYSAQVLADMGVTNTQVTGCPTNFVNRDPNFGEKLKEKWAREPVLVATTGDEPWPKNLKKRDAERRLIEMTMANGGAYVVQSVAPFVEAVRDGNPYQSTRVAETRLTALRNSLAPKMSLVEFRRFIGSYVRLYFDIDQWMEDASRYDLSVGLRLHGNMVAFQAGCPSIWIYHDSRTQELCKTMALPALSVEDFLATGNPQELKDKVNADFDHYIANRAVLYERYTGILREAGLTVRT